jgi:hypothetical protein
MFASRKQGREAYACVARNSLALTGILKLVLNATTHVSVEPPSYHAFGFSFNILPNNLVAVGYLQRNGSILFVKCQVWLVLFISKPRVMLSG